jgi:hypothetical protein
MLAAWRELETAARIGETSLGNVFGVSDFEYLAANPELSEQFNSSMWQGTALPARQLPRQYDFARFHTSPTSVVRAALRRSQFQARICDRIAGPPVFSLRTSHADFIHYPQRPQHHPGAGTHRHDEQERDAGSSDGGLQGLSASVGAD